MYIESQLAQWFLRYGENVTRQWLLSQLIYKKMAWVKDEYCKLDILW